MGVAGGLGGAGSEGGRGWGGVGKGRPARGAGPEVGVVPRPLAMRAARPSASGSFRVDALGLDLSLAVAETTNGAVHDADSVTEAAVLQ